MSDTKTLTLVKGQHQFLFTYTVGEEQALLDELITKVNDPAVPFDWFDAAVLSHQLGQNMAKQFNQYLPKRPDGAA